MRELSPNYKLGIAYRKGKFRINRIIYLFSYIFFNMDILLLTYC